MIRVLTFICALVLLPASVMAQGFFVSLPDVPLMAGLEELEARALSFDKPEGRIMIGVAAAGDSVSQESVQSYYSQSLPQFGWREVGPFSYVRGLETLEISLKNDGVQNILEITISP